MWQFAKYFVQLSLLFTGKRMLEKCLIPHFRCRIVLFCLIFSGFIGLLSGCNLYNRTNNSVKNVPVAIIPKALQRPTIDGVLSEQLWENAVKLDLLVNNGPNVGKKPNSTTCVALTWDRDNFYLAFVCNDLDISSEFATRDAELWGVGYEKIEIVELMIIPSIQTTPQYYEMNFNPCGALLDLEVKWIENKPIFNKSWDSNAKWSVTVNGTLNNCEDTDKNWIVEASLPWKDFNIDARQGMVLRANFFRTDNSELLRPYFSAWSPTGQPWFHVIERFGILKLGE